MARLTKYERVLVLLFILTVPLSNPWVRGDGVGYYAYVRSLLIEHRLDFTKDWLQANTTFRLGRTDAEGHITPEQYTATGHLNNHFSIGPAILWSPFLITAHIGVLLYDRLGGHIAADGYSRPYLVAMALGTAVYGFLALMISFALARRYVPERPAFLATLGIWFGSSLPVYMYFNPSWSHAHSAFIVALFVWYWLRTRTLRTWAQWAALGALGGLMLDIYYMNVVVLSLPLFESLSGYWTALRGTTVKAVGRLFLKNVIFAAAVFAAFLPTLLTKKAIYGGYLKFGYVESWFWRSPAFFKLCFSSDHGLFSWTPILILSVIGLFIFREYDRDLALYLLAIFVVYLYAMGCYQDWDGLSSFGNRFFVSLTALFVLGLAAFFEWLARAWHGRRSTAAAWTVAAVLIVWNLGLVYQWGTHLIPARGPISWRDAAYNQVAVVPLQATRTFENYLMRRKQLMGHIEDEDVKQIKSQPAEGRE